MAQGAAQSMEDGLALARNLADHKDDLPLAVAAYNLEKQPRGKKVQLQARDQCNNNRKPVAPPPISLDWIYGCLPGAFSRLFGQRLHLRCHHRKTAPGLTGPRRLDRSIERQQTWKLNRRRWPRLKLENYGRRKSWSKSKRTTSTVGSKKANKPRLRNDNAKKRSEKIMERWRADCKEMIAEEVKEFASAISDAGDKTYVKQRWPTLATWYREKIRGAWELENVSTDLRDYGTVKWKNRVLEAGFVEVTFKLKHRELGEHQQKCFLVVYVADRDFAVPRDPIAVPCEDANAVTRYKIAHEFSSKWIAN